MDLNPEACYRALLARDERHDGRFFTCVTTTRIYCRPVCPARPPKQENCLFVPSAAAAQELGFRPCLRCRPEKAPESWTGGAATTVNRALRSIEEGTLDLGNVADLAEQVGVGDRQLRRLFQQELGASPLAVAQTRRVLLALQLLQQTDLSMIDVALASGFQSVRRFNETFQKLYDRPPGELRRQRRRAAVQSSALTLLLPYRRPYDWEAMLRFLSERAIRGMEHVADGVYSRTIELDGAAGTLQVADAPEESALKATIEFPQLRSLPQIIARVRAMFDLNADIGAITTALSQDPVLAPLVAARPGLRVPGAWDRFELTVRAILGQHISVKGARFIAETLVAYFGAQSLKTENQALSLLFPPPARWQREEIERFRMTKARAAAIAHLAALVNGDPRYFEQLGRQASAVDQLQALPGIGQWTAQYVAMRALRASDAFPAADVGLQRALAVDGVRPTEKQLLAQAENWRPWRAYAAMHLWTSDALARPSRSRKRIAHATAT
ncbi:3-methyladenine DNA glycosylase 2 [Blastopirellula marina]|uniref:DNA-3-methyladenine glycosylase II n=2 Tax=Blastopirellula marina TaxID=124 RepID=A0A2S8GIY3_9BACT|nr:3-methyladenine DNA glycosylase 2 [Blastopirellula marina]